MNSSSSTKRGKLFECFSEPLRDNDGVERQRFTHVWPGIRVYLPQPPESSAQACKYHDCFGKELTEPSNFSDYDVNACGYYRLPADSYAAMDMGEQEVTQAMHAVVSGPTSVRTGGEIRFSKFSENMTTPGMQLRMDLEAMESELIPEVVKDIVLT